MTCSIRNWARSAPSTSRTPSIASTHSRVSWGSTSCGISMGNSLRQAVRSLKPRAGFIRPIDCSVRLAERGAGDLNWRRLGSRAPSSHATTQGGGVLGWRQAVAPCGRLAPRYDHLKLGHDRVKGEVVRSGRDFVDDLQLEGAGNASGGAGQRREQSIVVATAVADAMTACIEGYARHKHPVDRRELHRRTAGARLGDAAIAGLDIAPEIANDMNVQHAPLEIDARHGDR